MMRIWLSVAAVLLATTAAQAKLEIENIQASYGFLGPERKTLDTYPGDELLFRFTIKGAKVSPEGKVEVNMTVKMTNTNGDIALLNEVALRHLLSLGGDSFPASTRFTLGEKTPPDDYTLTITITDKQSLEKASFQRKLTCKPSAFALVAPEFFYDLKGEQLAPPGGVVGQVLYFRMHGIGIDRTLDKIDTTMTIQVLDAKGKEMLPKPLTADVKNDDAEVVRKAWFVTYRGQVYLNRAGEFTLRVTLTDNIAKKTAKFETPLRVTAP